MVINFFTKGDKNVASSRQRVWFVAEELYRRYGYEGRVCYAIHYPFWSLSRRRWYFLRRLFSALQDRNARLLYVHKSIYPFDFVLCLLVGRYLFKKRMIYDLDDAEWLHSRIKSILLARFADVVFCGSQEILNWAKRYNNNVRLIPTVIHADIYGKYRASCQKGNKLTVGWAGWGPSYFRDGHLDILHDVFCLLSKMGILVTFVCVGSKNYTPLKNFFKSPYYKSIFYDELNWGDPHSVPKSFYQEKVTVGVAPLRMGKFDMAKCAFKIIEYFGMGIPVVASPVGEQSIVVRDGREGFLPRTKKEWVTSLHRLTDQETWNNMSRAAIERVRERYTYDAIIPIIYNEITVLFS